MEVLKNLKNAMSTNKSKIWTKPFSFVTPAKKRTFEDLARECDDALVRVAIMEQRLSDLEVSCLEWFDFEDQDANDEETNSGDSYEPPNSQEPSQKKTKKNEK